MTYYLEYLWNHTMYDQKCNKAMDILVPIYVSDTSSVSGQDEIDSH